jgi:phytoene dehydrogenase-like protein
MYDTLILGAGMSGLAAGIRLAHYDQQVCILERHTTVGGLNSFYRRHGRNFDVGLHALTNFAPKGDRQGPLARLLRQLRLRYDDLELAPQTGSRIAFPGMSLRFANGLDVLREEIRRQFPDQTDRFERLVASLASYEDLGRAGTEHSAREIVGQMLTDPLLVEMLFCPVLFYGGSRERDLEFGQFSILFRSIYLEGLARPCPGVRQILKLLVRRFKQLGGQLRLRAGVRRIVLRGSAVEGVVLDDGTEMPARCVLSSIGWRETMRLCGTPPGDLPPAGQISFVESISVLNLPPAALGMNETAVFYNDSPAFDYVRPDEAVDLRSGVVCSPDNFHYAEPPKENILRITCLANYDRWAALDASTYRLAKQSCYERMAAAAARFVPDFRKHVLHAEVFTPTTIERFTGHANGAVYGGPAKRYDGATGIENLFLCGTDQGLVGIVGALLSGITIANRRLRRVNS